MQTADASLLAWLPRLRRYARALARNSEDADDLVQDTLERAWTRAESWSRVSDMRAWLFSIMHNLHVDRFRRAGLDTVELDDTTDQPVRATQTDGLAVRDLASALQRLPLDQRQVLFMVGVEDMSYAEVAALLAVPVGTVMSRLSRGRERLRALLDGEAATSSPPLRLVK